MINGFQQSVPVILLPPETLSRKHNHTDSLGSHFLQTVVLEGTRDHRESLQKQTRASAQWGTDTPGQRHFLMYKKNFTQNFDVKC